MVNSWAALLYFALISLLTISALNCEASEQRKNLPESSSIPLIKRIQTLGEPPLEYSNALYDANIDEPSSTIDGEMTESSSQSAELSKMFSEEPNNATVEYIDSSTYESEGTSGYFTETTLVTNDTLVQNNETFHGENTTKDDSLKTISKAPSTKLERPPIRKQDSIYMDHNIAMQPARHRQRLVYAGLPGALTNHPRNSRYPHLALPMHRYQMGFLDMVLKGYDNRVWPTYNTNEPTMVMVNLYINSISSIRASEMEYTMDIYLRQSWVDPRLALAYYGVRKSVYLNGENIISRIWKPDLFFRNVKEANFHAITVPNVLVKIGPRGEVLHSSRLTLKLACQMSFRNYPMDRQRCPIVVGSYSYTSDVVRLLWMNRAILLDHKMEIPDYYLTSVSKSHPYYKTFIVIGEFNFLNATFTLQRQNGYHMVQTYLPTCLIVMISWVSFWLNVDASPARTTLGVTTLLALTTVASGIRRQLPPVSYIKAVDVWIGACSVMVFGTLFEFALVNFLSRSKLKPTHIRRSVKIFQVEGHRRLEAGVAMQTREQILAENLKRARMVDRICRILFPFVFFVFNLGYWIYYLYVSQKN